MAVHYWAPPGAQKDKDFPLGADGENHLEQCPWGALSAKLVVEGSAAKWKSRFLTSPRQPRPIVTDETSGLTPSAVHRTSCICAPPLHRTCLQMLPNIPLVG